MNNLTLFLYLVEILGRLPVAATISTLIFLAVWFFSPPKGVEIFGHGHDFPFMGFDKAKPMMYVSAVLVTLAFLIPSRDTLYLMAGSEVAEFAVSTPEAQEFMKDVKEVLDIQLEKLKQ